MAAVSARRTGRMGDIVATIQAEQDRIIRATPSGVLVVQGGPGTGKTAVALHRAAYLLYTHRDRLARRGVLVVGPNATFLRYIGQVLPSLGETSVVLGTVAQLFPGLDARRAEAPEVAEVKGRVEMAGVIAAAVRDRQQVPRRPVELVVEQQRVRLDRDVANAARSRARRSRRPHNEAKRIFHREAVRLLAEQVARNLAGPWCPRPARRRRPLRHPRRADRELGSSTGSWTRCGRRCRPSSCSPTCSPTSAGSTRSPAACPRRTASGSPAGPRAPTRPTTCAGRPRTCRCSTRPPSCSATTARRLGRGRRRRCARRCSTPRACSTCSTWRRTSTRSCCAPPTSSTPTGSPNASGCAATTPPRSGRPRTASGPTAT